MVTAVIAIVLAGCAGPPPASGAAASAGGFTVGEVYTVTKPMKAVTWGTETSLVPVVRRHHSAPPPKALRDVPPGTVVRVQTIRTENTLTHGIERSPVGVVQGGPLHNTRLSLADPGLRKHLQRTNH